MANQLGHPHQLLADFVENGTVGMHWVGPDGTILWANKAELDLLGYAEDEYVGHHVSEFHVDRPAADDILRRLLRDEVIRDYEARLRCRDGSIRHVLIDAGVMRDRGTFVHARCLTRDVTEQKRVEEALRESERRFAQFMRHLPGLAWIKDAKGRYVFANDAAEAAFRTPRSHLYGRTDHEVFPPDTAEQFVENDRSALASSAGGVQVVETLADEHEVVRHSLVSKFPIPGPDGAPAMVGGMAIDITEHVQVERRTQAEHSVSRALAEARTLDDAAPRILRAVCETTGWEWAALWRVDAHESVLRCAQVIRCGARDFGEFEQVSRAAAFAPGVGLPGRVWATAQPAWIVDLPSDDNFPRKAVALLGGLHGAVAFPVVSGGRVLGVMEFFSPRVKPPDNALMGMLSAVGEQVGQFVERTQAEQALHDSEQRLRLALEAGRMGTWEWIIQTGRVVWSAGLEAIHGLAPDTFGGTFEAFIADVHPDDRQRVAEQVARTVELRQDHEIEYRILLGDGTVRWVEGRGKLFCDPGGRPERLVGVCADVTERKRSERERAELLSREQAARAEMEKANRAKDEFLAVLSHELRTPLTPVLTAAQMMERDGGLTADQREVATIVRRNVELEARLIDDLLDLTRISRDKLELFLAPVDVHQKLRHVSDICDPDARSKGVTLTLELRAERHLLRADAARVQQVFWNLLKNAVKFTPGGGTIRVRTDNPDHEHIRIEVQDTGCGIAPSVLPTIFDAFSQGGREVTRRHGGLGLGLTIAKRLVEMHGGTLTAISDGEGNGSTFVIELPLVGAVVAMPPASLPQDVRQIGGDGRILLVEDNADTSHMMSRLLRGGGYEVCTADGVASALRAADSQPFDLLICDIGLPDGSGLDLMRQLLAKRPIRGIALSGFGMEEDVQRSKAAGFAEHLTKPVNLQYLEAVIRRHVGSAASVQSVGS